MVLKYCCVWGHDLEQMLFFLATIWISFADRAKRITMSCFLQALWEPNDHGSCVLDDIHSFWVQNGYEHERVRTFHNRDSFLDSFHQLEALIQIHTNLQSNNFRICLTLWLHPIFDFKFLLELKVVEYDTVMD